MKTSKDVKKNGKKKFRYILIIYCLIIIISFFSHTLSKYKGNVDTEKEVHIAKPMVQANAEVATKQIYPTGTVEFPFEVRNYDSNGTINETLLKYKLQVQNNSGYDIGYKIYEISSTNQKSLISDINNYYSYFSAGTQESKKYVISVTWNDNNINSSDIANIQLNEVLNIKVISTQVLEK